MPEAVESSAPVFIIPRTAWDDAATATVIRADLISVTAQLQAADAERLALGSQRQSHDAAVADSAALVDWCATIAKRLPGMGAAERRMVIEMLSVEVVLYGRGHRPRWGMELTAPSMG